MFLLHPHLLFSRIQDPLHQDRSDQHEASSGDDRGQAIVAEQVAHHPAEKQRRDDLRRHDKEVEPWPSISGSTNAKVLSEVVALQKGRSLSPAHVGSRRNGPRSFLRSSPERSELRSRMSFSLVKRSSIHSRGGT